MIGLVLLTVLVICILLTLYSAHVERQAFEKTKARKLRMIKGEKE